MRLNLATARACRRVLWLPCLCRLMATGLQTLLIAVLAGLGCAYPARAADISIRDYPSKSIVLTGDIRSGDLAKVQAAWNDCMWIDGQLLALNLESPGGDLVEAMKIGRFVHEAWISTDAPKVWLEHGVVTHNICSDPEKLEPTNELTCYCASACALIWLAGAHRHGDAVGFHRPYLPDHSITEGSAARFPATYAEARKEVGEYLLAINMKQMYADLMFDTPSNSIRWVAELVDTGDPEFSRFTNPVADELSVAHCGASEDDYGRAYDELRKELREKGVGLKKKAAEVDAMLACQRTALRDAAFEYWVQWVKSRQSPDPKRAAPGPEATGPEPEVTGRDQMANVTAIWIALAVGVGAGVGGAVLYARQAR